MTNNYQTTTSKEAKYFQAIVLLPMKALRFSSITLFIVWTSSFLLPIFSAGQNNRLWATYYGGLNDDKAWSVVTDVSGNVYLTGYTNSPAGMASGGFQTQKGGGYDAFVVKFDGNGNRLWASYYGGKGDEFGVSVATDALGNVYLIGNTASTDFIASSGFQNNYGGGFYDAFLVKFDPFGNRLWATYYGGMDDDNGHSVTTDIGGNVYLTGWTKSTDFIASGGFQNTCWGNGNYDAFVVKFNSAGNRLWSTYYGDEGNDFGFSVATDASLNVYLTGYTNSPSEMASGGFQNTFSGFNDAFLVKFNALGNRLWATYYGGTDNDAGMSVATDTSGNIYLAGEATSTSGIASGGFQTVFSGGSFSGDLFLVKFDGNGNRLWATYYGGTGDEEEASVATDVPGNVYLAGDTYSTSSIASGGFQNSNTGLENEFVVKFESNGNRLCATYFGNLHEEEGHIAADGLGNIYLSGFTPSASGISSGGFQPVYGGGSDDAYLVKFSTCSNSLTLNVVSTNVNCNGQCTGTATVTPTSGNSPYTYSWNTIPIQTTQIATGLCAGTYTVTVTDATSNNITSNVVITQPITVITASVSSFVNVTCTGLCDGSATVIASGGIPDYTFAWNTVPLQTTASATGLCAGNYSVTITDATGCSGSNTVTIITLYSIPTAFFIYQPQPATILDPFIQFTDSSVFNISSWLWSFGDIINGVSAIQNPKYSYMDTGTYIVQLIVTDIHGCRDTTHQTIFIKADYLFYVPNSFTPNGDGINDAFIPETEIIIPSDYSLMIFNRWGNKVFETTNYKQEWDGKINNTNAIAQEDVYIWKVNLLDFNSQRHNYIGNVAIVK